MGRFRLHLGKGTPTPTPSAAVTYDTAMGTAVDANGFASLPLRAGAKAFYVNSSTGSDSRTSTQAQSPTTPVATIAKASTFVTTGTGDHILVAQDTTYSEGVPDLRGISGFSAAYPFSIQSYDPADPTNQATWGRATGSHRPVVTGATNANFLFGTNPMNYIALRGFDFNPGAVAGAQINCVGPASGVHTYTLIENNLFRYTTFSFDNVGSSPTAHYWNNPGIKLILRNNALYGQFDVSAGVGNQGLYTANIDGVTVEDNVFYHCGWKIGLLDTDHASIGGHNQFNHPIYAGDNTMNMVVRRNAFVNNSADGSNIKGGGIYQNNFSLRNPIAWSAGSGNGYSVAKPFGSYIDFSGNVAIGSNMIDGGSPSALGWGMTSNDGRAGGLAVMRYNVIARNDQASAAFLMGSANGGDPNYGNYTIDDNTVFDHNVGYLWAVGGTGGGTQFTGGTLVTATNNKWDDAPSGSNTTVVGGSLPNAYTEATLLAALPGAYASETAAINDWIANPEQHGWRNATTLALAGYGVTQPQVDLKTDMRITAGVANRGLFIGTLDGYDLSVVSGLPSGVTIDSDGRGWRADTSCTASSGNLVIRESNGTNTHDSTIAWAIYAAPVLSSLSVTPSTTSAAAHVSTNVGSGHIYAMASPDTTTAPVWPEVRAGYLAIGDPSDLSVNRATASATANVSATGAQGTITLTGLTTATAYRLRIVQVDANNNASVVSTSDFTTT